MEETFNYHVDLIILAIENNEAVKSCIGNAREKARNLLNNGTHIDARDIAKFPEFFELRIKTNRKVIDLEKFYPTKMEMDEALNYTAENIFDDIVAYEDITNPDFYC